MRISERLTQEVFPTEKLLSSMRLGVNIHNKKSTVYPQDFIYAQRDSSQMRLKTIDEL